ncbi:MAG: prepilin-type N-terminal cleavage/methylation domain-containing protein [Candidatus Saelkia tenebricola]|nr:prepilin-type N-terminal cleavage/methylation domain-containing protein [Candidatus Saelkia tenebricola]
MKKGFTMLEILIVIIIVAILATFAIPQYLKASKRAIAAEAVTTIGAIRGGLARYYQEYMTLTATLSELDVDNPNEVSNRNFGYSFTGGTLDTYEVKACGKNRADGIEVTYDAASNTIDINYESECVPQ